MQTTANTVALALGLLLTGCATKSGAHAASGASAATVIQLGKAKEELLAGNQRYLAGGMHTHDWLNERIVKTGNFGQSPSVGVLSCADSRVPVELVFDQGVGDLFVVRLAGFVDSVEGTGTFEYGYLVLGMHSLVVLGHTKCGAVEATLEGKPLPGSIPSIAAAIAPAVSEQVAAAKQGKSPQLSQAAVKANVLHQKKTLLERSEVLRNAHAEGKLDVLCAVYDVETGAVSFLD